MSRRDSDSISPTQRATVSALGLRFPTIHSQRLGKRSPPSSAFKLPWRATNIIIALRKTAEVGICGFCLESRTRATWAFQSKTFST